MDKYAMNKLLIQPRATIVNQSSIHNRQSTMNRQSSIVNRQCFALVILATAIIGSEPDAPEKFVHPEALTAVDAVAKWVIVRDPGTVLIDARSAESFVQGHIPGARNIQSDLLQEPEKPPYFMPDAESVKKLCAEAGINPDTHVVIYD